VTALGPPDPYRHPLAWARYQAGGLKAYLAGPAWLRRQMRRQLLLALIERHVTRIVAVDGDGIRYLIDTADRGPITLRIFSEGRYEEPLVARVSGLLADVRDEPRPLENRAFVDVGANIGTATLVALKRFGATRALALEPHPANLRLLRMNLIANELEERATVMGVAASDGPGELELEMATHNIGDHRIRTGAESGRGAVEEGSRAVIRVPAVRLDEAVAEAGIGLDEIGLVWIDVQGHEPQVLKGADSLVDAAVPMLIEYWPYGLARAGGLDALHRIISERFSEVWNLGEEAGAEAVAPIDPSDVALLASRYPSENDSTNLLLLRAPRSTAAASAASKR